MMARLAGLAIDARFALRGTMPGAGEAIARAHAARWIAANALATRGVRVAVEGTPPREPSVLALHATSLVAAIAAIAALPVLIDAATLPCRWRLALRALGLPTLDRSAADALAAGASVLSSHAAGPCELAVDRESRGYRVRLGWQARTLTA